MDIILSNEESTTEATVRNRIAKKLYAKAERLGILSLFSEPIKKGKYRVNRYFSNLDQAFRYAFVPLKDYKEGMRLIEEEIKGIL